MDAKVALCKVYMQEEGRLTEGRSCKAGRIRAEP